MLQKLINTLSSENWEEARWLAEAILHLNEVSRVQSSKHSTKTLVPLSAVDLRTLLVTLLEIQTLQGVSMDSTSRSKLKSFLNNPSLSNATASNSGQKQEPAAAGSRAKPRRLPSKRRYWPGEAKDVFWNLVRSLNKYDKEFMPQGKKSPVQLEVAEEITRRWWELEYGNQSPVVKRRRERVGGGQPAG